MQQSHEVTVGDHNYVARQSTTGNDEVIPIYDNEVQPEQIPERRSRRSRLQLQLPGSNTTGGSDHDYIGSGTRRRRQPALVDLTSAEEGSVRAGDDNTGRPQIAATTSASAQEPELDASVAIVNSVDNIELASSPVQQKKRKRTSRTNTPRVKTTSKTGISIEGEEEDDGLTCPICLDNWEMSGEHRLVSLRCGHLFGDSCIRRWLTESARQSGVKVCPQCKAKAANRDIRFLYAKRLRAIDRSEEHQLREELEEEKRRSKNLYCEFSNIKVSLAMATARIQTLETENERLKNGKNSMVTNGRAAAAGLGYIADSSLDVLNQLKYYKLALERSIDIAREAGCRVMVYAKEISSIVVSQKSSQNLFPGYGLRFIDISTFRPTNFLHASPKLVRDVCLNADDHMVAVTSMEPRSKMFDLRVPSSVAMFTPSDKGLWSCCMDRAERDRFLYLGAQHGSTYVYDTREPDNFLAEFKTEGDLSPVINVTTVPANNDFPSGGFIVCKLQSLWFYEYMTASNTAEATRLDVEGPFISMNFDGTQETVLVSVRNSSRFPQSRYLLGKLKKIGDVPIFDINVTFFGSSTTPVMIRSCQIVVEQNTLVAGYTQDNKMLALFDARRSTRTFSMPIQDLVYDTCPVYTQNTTYLAALTETKCRIYKVNSMP